MEDLELERRLRRTCVKVLDRQAPSWLGLLVVDLDLDLLGDVTVVKAFRMWD